MRLSSRLIYQASMNTYIIIGSQSCIGDLFPTCSTVALQIGRFLSKFASGRSFGLPVGGQCARILAEVMMSPIDQVLRR